MPDIYAQWHGGVSVTSEKQKNLIRESFMTDFSYICTRNNCCGVTQTVFISWETEALRFCLVSPNLENSNKGKAECDGSRITWACRLIVCTQRFFPAPELSDVGLSGPRSLYPCETERRIYLL